MQLISTAQIKYFRSIYTTTLKNCGSLNVISGRNDAGKSNILRALNLFFNGQTDWQAPIDFYRDFSLQRLDQVRKESVKGKQFIQVQLEFRRPDNYKGSLPPRFRVTRTWFRDQALFTESNNLAQLFKAGKCPTTLAAAQRFLPILLNRIRFEYVPAVKDRNYFSHLLSRLQASLLNFPLDSDNPVTPFAENLASHIGSQVAALQEDFHRATGIETTIEPPKEFAALFQAFQVSTPGGDEQIPLALRGDGLQARYISSVLHYISAKSAHFFVWGFEEPENSLEYSHADSLAEDFEERYSSSVQVFLTSHSPAFVARTGPQTACYRVVQEASRTVAHFLARPIDSTVAGNDLLKEIGLIQIQEEIHDQYRARLEKLELTSKRVGELEAELEAHSKPLLLVEGPTDRAILETAWRKLYGTAPMPFTARAADPLADVDSQSAGGAAALARAIESIHPSDERRVLALFDHDGEGVKRFNALSKHFKRVEGKSHVRRHVNGFALAATLGSLRERCEYAAASNLSIEFLFPDEALQFTTRSGAGLVLEDFCGSALVQGGRQMQLSENQAEKVAQALGVFPHYRRIVSGKRVFAERVVPRLASEQFSSFRTLFEAACQILGVPSPATQGASLQ